MAKRQKQQNFSTERRSQTSYLRQSSPVFKDLTDIARQFAPNSCIMQLVNRTRSTVLQPLCKPNITTLADELIAGSAADIDMEILVQELLARMCLTDSDIDDINMATVDQSHSSVWKQQRQGRITASNFSRVVSWTKNSGTQPDADPSICSKLYAIVLQFKLPP